MTISRIHLDGLTSQKMSKLPNFPMQRANNQTGTETFIYIGSILGTSSSDLLAHCVGRKSEAAMFA